MKGIIYIRVSSDEQVKGTSLASQESKCRSYCAEKNIEVEHVFREEGESAKTADRTELLKALEFCRKRRGKIAAFVVYKVDRFSRHTEDHFAVKSTLFKYGTALHSATEPIGNDPVSRLLETMLAGYSDFDNAIRKQRCSDGMSAKIDQGLFPWHAPIGYKTLRANAHGKKKTEPDPPHPDTFPILQVGLREYAAGLHTKSGVAKRLDQLGLAALRGRKTRGSMAHFILEKRRIKFYAGIIENPWTGKDVAGLHQPMLTKSEMYAILARLGDKKPVRRKRYNPRFPLRGLIQCSSCERPMTASSATGRGGRYHYYHCYSKDCPFYGKMTPKKDMESAFIALLRKLTPGRQFLSMLRLVIADRATEYANARSKAHAAAKKRLRALEKRRNRLCELHEDGTYTKADFSRRKQDVEEAIAAEERLLDSQGGGTNLLDQVEDVIQMAGQLPELWLALNVDLKERLKGLMFPAGLEYSRKHGLRTHDHGLLYSLFLGFGSSMFCGVHPRDVSTNGGDLWRKRQEAELRKLVNQSWDKLVADIDEWSRCYELYVYFKERGEHLHEAA